tara:strand:+ start:2652 stop:4274 length:1623 start_codon:yes stop_codon:yes gene_type:complete
MVSQKISQFNVSTSLSDNDLFTFVINSTNKNVNFSDFKSSLGVTGTLNQVGDPLGVPVLNQPTSGVNDIRSFESGAGILFSVSAQNGIVGKWNVSQDAAGVPLTDGLNRAKPVIASAVAGQGMSITKTNDVITFTNTVDPATGLSNRVVVTQASDFAGTLDSTKEYFIDGVIDMGSQSIEVPAGGLNLTGYNFDVSKLISSAAGYTMFTSPGGGSGNLLGKDYAVEVTGAGSQAYNLTSATGFDAFEFSRINYNDCESLGIITNYRQGLEVGTGRFGGKPQLTLAGTWLGGYFIDTSIVRSLTDGAYSLFSAGAGFVMSSRFRSNQNIDLPASASFFDFAPGNFVNPSTLQIEGAIVTRNGVFDANDSNITPNITRSELVSNWMGNNGMPNTFVGGSIGVTTEAITTITTPLVFVDLAAASWTSADLQHFDNPSAGQLRHLGNNPREFKIIADMLLDSTPGDDLRLRVTKWDDSAASFITVLDQTREVNSFQGGRDVAFFNININTTLDENDYIKFQVANVLATNNITAETDSYYIIEAR